MKLKKQIGIFSLALVASCGGPAVPYCVVLEDLKTEHCIPFDSHDPEFQRNLKAGDYAFTPDEIAVMQRWYKDHKK